MADQIQTSARGVDLSQRFIASTTIVASPSAASETIVAQIAIPANLFIATGVILKAQAVYTVGTNGTTSNLKIRRTDTSGQTIVATGTLATAAASLQAPVAMGLDTAPVGAQVYVATLTIANGSAASTLTAVFLSAIVV